MGVETCACLVVSNQNTSCVCYVSSVVSSCCMYYKCISFGGLWGFLFAISVQRRVGRGLIRLCVDHLERPLLIHVDNLFFFSYELAFLG